MAKTNKAAAETGAKMQGATADGMPAGEDEQNAFGHGANDATGELIASGNVRLGDSGADTAVQAANSDGVAAATEHPLDIIGEIEHLLRIVGNVAVHEFRRISERLADLKNHPSVKAPE
ncbi:hypothetical protein [Burkholderia multivorans]|uniref:hypothetical protein n=1 Tax=Burkholderia multivorans TaxID=87883 RepID=UPI000CFF1EA8|nr:hypothetical protein [Burkholderia multivorans]PRH15463.1 hypothetical protein C6T71_30570 [Burkholderia multivorans]